MGELAGTVTDILPSGLYRVRLDDGPPVVAHSARGIERNFLRVLVGDRVRLEISPMDSSRGRIVEKLKGNLGA